MKNKKAVFLLASMFLAFTLLACSRPTIEEEHECAGYPPSKLSKVSIFLYRENSSKIQPEQIATIDKEISLRSWDSAFEEKGKETLPAKAIKGIFLYDKEPLKHEKALQRKCFIFVKFEDGSGYYKEFPLSEKFEIQSYTKQSGEELLKKLGLDNWGREPNEGSDHDLWRDQQLK